MSKVLARAGISLSSVYDVKGSIVGVEELLAKEVHLVHEMGGQIFSERMVSTIQRTSTGAIAQNITWGNTLASAGAGPSRVLGIQVFADVASRLTMASVALRDPIAEREIPVWVWDATTDLDTDLRIDDDGTIANVQLLQSIHPGYLPSMLLGTDQRRRVNEIVFRGVTSGFGAGTVTVTAIIHSAFAELGGVGSFGLPIPGW